MKTLAQFTKFGISIFVVLAALAGYALGFESEMLFSWTHLLKTLGGVFFLSSGSLALNQVQEYKLDRLMPRTSQRPIASGRLKPAAGLILSLGFVLVGLKWLWDVSEIACGLGVLTLVLYNGIYTYIWKPRWIYAAVPGALPGALPVSIGYAAINANLFNFQHLYLFLILFLWQMPHFWALAIRFKDDYRAGSVPTLPVALGLQRTLFQLVIYSGVYVILAVASPWFVGASWFYLLLVIPISLQLLWETRKFYLNSGGFLRYFLWINLSVLVYLFVPALDKWAFLIFERV